MPTSGPPLCWFDLPKYSAARGERYINDLQRTRCGSSIRQLSSGGSSQRSPFAIAVHEALNNPHQILNFLFSIRSAPLLSEAARGPGLAARLSGLLIGLEIAGMLSTNLTKVSLIASGEISKAYEAALKISGMSVTVLDADELIRAGLTHYAQLITGHRQD